MLEQYIGMRSSFINTSSFQARFLLCVCPELVEKPVLTGPSKVIAGLRYSWYCVADGANRAVPTIEWFFGNGTNISHGYDSEDNSYNDKDELLT